MNAIMCLLITATFYEKMIMEYDVHVLQAVFLML